MTPRPPSTTDLERHPDLHRTHTLFYKALTTESDASLLLAAKAYVATAKRLGFYTPTACKMVEDLEARIIRVTIATKQPQRGIWPTSNTGPDHATKQTTAPASRSRRLPSEIF